MTASVDLANPSALVPLIASIAYIPLFVILVSNRPWQRRHKLFLLFLVSAVLWSFSTFLSRSTLPGQYEPLGIKIVICLTLWMLVQLHYFVYSFYQSERVRIPWASVFVIAAIVLAASNFYFVSTDQGVRYGPSIIALVLVFLFTVGVKDVVSLWRRRSISPDPEERNQIVYLLAAIGVLTAFISVSVSELGARFPVSHIGNLVIACVLTYAVVTHRLLDVRVIVRQAIIYVVLYGGGLAIVLALVSVALRYAGSGDSGDLFRILAAIILLGVPAMLFLVYKVRDLWQKKVEKAFIGARYSYRRQLSEFIDKIHDVPTLEQLGNRFISLLADSLDCRRACLLVPDADNEWFSTRFTYPPVADNPMKNLKLNCENPLVVWLEREKRILPVRNLAIYPEFQSLWAKEREELGGVDTFVPLLNNGKLVAILAVSGRRDGKPYAVEDNDWMESIGAQVAASMENRYSDEQLREQDAQTSLVNRLTAIITSSMSIQEIFEAFIRELKTVVDIDWATIALIDGNELDILALSSTIGSAWQLNERIPLEGTATEVACRERRAVYESDLKRHHVFWTWETHVKQGISSVVYLPLSVTGRVIGTLVLANRRPNAYTRSQIKLLEKVALQIAAPIENAKLYARVEQKSRIDELTGLFNRRHFEERLKEEVARHSRYGNAFSIFMLDLDNFKNYNDVYGHPAGDSLLNEIGGIIKRSVRDADQAFRYGGDEFVVILPETARDDAYVVAERVRGQVAADMEKKSISVTCSIGLSSYPLDGVITGELVNGADTALYYAKWTGGDRTYFSSGVSSEPPEDGRTRGRRNGLRAVYDLVEMVESRDRYLYGHSRGVNTYAVALAEALGMSPDEVSRVSTAALLHDVGKVGIADEIWNKKEKLTKEDWDAIKTHPRLGANIVGNYPQLVPCMNSILHLHERWDGRGYPDGLKGDEIPIESRILTIADTFDAMSSARPYRAAFSRQEVVEELKRCAGSQFDPNLVELFIGIIQAGLPEKVKAGRDSTGQTTNP